MTVSSENLPPHDLQLVVDYVNTRDLDEDTEALGTAAALVDWLRARGLLRQPPERPEPIGAAELTQALALREALRTTLLAHSGARPGEGAADAEAARLLEAVAERGRLSVRFDAQGEVQLAPRATGFAGALAALLAPIAQSAADGSWARVKACAADDCQWAFYDQSRNRSGRWCDMAVCGNRTKVRAYRTKRGG